MEINEIKRKLFDKYYNKLNDMQKQAVYTVNGPLLVVAGAGSGKTTVLVERIAHIIKYGNAYYSTNKINASDDEIKMLETIASDEFSADEAMLEPMLKCFADNPCYPDKILAITFTNKAANEIKQRLQTKLGDKADLIWAGTFHSICVRILRRFSEYTTLSKDFTIYDTEDSKKVITEILKEKEISDEEITPKFILNEISKAKNKLLTPEEYEMYYAKSDKYKTVSEIYSQYQNRLKSANSLDFDDIIFETVNLLRNNDYVKSWCNDKFDYVLVDEYQDTNKSQYLLLKEICAVKKNIMAVGDDDQSIYKFRGAVVENILNFDKDFENSKVIFLEQNYRSTQTIVDAAGALIAHNDQRRGKNIYSKRNLGNKIAYNCLEDQEKEASYIAEKISEEVYKNKRSYKDFAILYRARAQSNIIESVFAKSGIPHRMLAGTRFYERSEVKDILAYLRLINNPDDDISLQRIINVPKRGIGAKAISDLKETAYREGISLYKTIKQINQFPELSKYKEKFINFSNLIDNFIDYSNNHLPCELLAKIIDDINYYLLFTSKEDEEKKKNVEELISSTLQYQEKAEEPSLFGFLEEVSLVSDVDNYDNESNAVVLMTIHSAKGLEFPVVFLPGMEETIFPSSLSSLSESEIQEERRLCYVALTRAKEELYTSSCMKRTLYGRTSYNRISRFLQEIPEKFFENPPIGTIFSNKPSFSSYGNTNVSTKPMHGNYNDNSLFKKEIGISASSVNKSKSVTFIIGDRVNHKLFGNGTVISSKNYGSDILYEIEFDTVGTKKLMATYAKLTKI